ncbi:IucA/IucC family C-terminal-domain containing protein [Rhizomonospora bruguierae]|uniref:IucA/IucC family C-terminal-domain containing protein n=1 Tax=Rhizomonospora bruguierae TaxID=1581705 RepID=UPI0020C11175|nr:IucA/IucC family C-terminal-domain containing protein [Micromonospora sp. NBRC 107566]
MFGTDRLPGLAPGLTVHDTAGWHPATTLIDGTQLPALCASANRRWRGAAPHVTTALAWKAYTYWLALPAVLGWASARRIPLLTPSDVLVHFADHRPLVTFGLHPATNVAILPSDPLAALALPQVRVAPDEAALLDLLRDSLLDAHLTPLAERLSTDARLGRRTLLGSLASGVAHGLIRATDTVPGPIAETIDTLLRALNVADLVDLVPGRSGELTVQRKTCCLAFALPQPKVCTGCCIR